MTCWWRRSRRRRATGAQRGSTRSTIIILMMRTTGSPKNTRCVHCLFIFFYLYYEHRLCWLIFFNQLYQSFLNVFVPDICDLSCESHSVCKTLRLRWNWFSRWQLLVSTMWTGMTKVLLSLHSSLLSVCDSLNMSITHQMRHLGRGRSHI